MDRQEIAALIFLPIIQNQVVSQKYDLKPTQEILVKLPQIHYGPCRIYRMVFALYRMVALFQPEIFSLVPSA